MNEHTIRVQQNKRSDKRVDRVNSTRERHTTPATPVANLAPKPRKTSSLIYELYEVVEANGGSATVKEVHKLIPAIHEGKRLTRKRVHSLMHSSGVNHGYFVEKDDVFSIASLEHFTERKALRDAQRVSGDNKRAARKAPFRIKNVVPKKTPSVRTTGHAPVVETLPAVPAVDGRTKFAIAALSFAVGALSLALLVSLGLG